MVVVDKLKCWRGVNMAARIICRLLLQCEVASLAGRYDWIVE